MDNTKISSYLIMFEGNASAMNASKALLTLIELNDKMALRYLPVIIYISILMILGFIGNVIVCIVYINKKKRTSVCYFILTLALLDLLNCVIGMPNEIVDLRYPYMFYSSVACKILRTIQYISTVGSTVVLLAVAVDRYNRICNLGNHMSITNARRVCLLAIVVGVVTSWPVPILGGLSKFDINIDKVTAVDCSIDENVIETVYPTIFNGILCIYFVFCTIFYGVIYSRIIVYVKKRKAITRTMSKKKDHTNNEDENNTRLLNGNSTPNTSQRSMKISDSSHRKHGIKVTRTTVILGAVTFAFIISYLPYLTLMAVRTIKKDFDTNLNTAADIGIKICVKSYLINNAINPIIYCFLNKTFREDVRELFKRY